MIDDKNEIDITLPLKKWEKCDLSFDKATAFCREKSIELRTKAKRNDVTFKTPVLVPQADMYDLCIIMLNLARRYDGEFFALDHTKEGVVFGFRFDTENCASIFHDEFVIWVKRAKLVDPNVDISDTKTFSQPKKKGKNTDFI